MSDSKSLQRERTINFNPSKDPFGWIQWKGTEVCIDIHCSCGVMTHYDGDFMYHIKCSHCGQVYEANGHIELIPVVEKDLDDPMEIDNIKVAKD